MKSNKQHQYPNGLLQEIRDKATIAKTDFISKLKEKLEQQSKLPKQNNAFKTASTELVEEYFKQNSLNHK